MGSKCTFIYDSYFLLFIGHYLHRLFQMKCICHEICCKTKNFTQHHDQHRRFCPNKYTTAVGQKYTQRRKVIYLYKFPLNRVNLLKNLAPVVVVFVAVAAAADRKLKSNANSSKSRIPQTFFYFPCPIPLYLL